MGFEAPVIFRNGVGWVKRDPRPAWHDLEGVVVGVTVSIKDIIAAAVRVTGVPEAVLMDRSVAPALVKARWAMWLAACETSKHSRSMVAKRMGRDHSTLYHALRGADRELADRIKAEAVRALG